VSRYGLEIRSAAPDDAGGLADMLEVCGPPVDAALLSRRLEAAAAGSGAWLVASEWGPPTGLIAVHWFADLFAPGADLVGRGAFVSLLFVAEDQRRRGVGRLLLKAASQAARAACSRLCLAAPSGREDLDDFCRATGFEAAGTLHIRSLRKASSPRSAKGARGAGAAQA
jgi:GNAT superfamily N-acetyltransferase